LLENKKSADNVVEVEKEVSSMSSAGVGSQLTAPAAT
jgi:hypothetical protein